MLFVCFFSHYILGLLSKYWLLVGGTSTRLSTHCLVTLLYVGHCVVLCAWHDSESIMCFYILDYLDGVIYSSLTVKHFKIAIYPIYTRFIRFWLSYICNIMKFNWNYPQNWLVIRQKYYLSMIELPVATHGHDPSATLTVDGWTLPCTTARVTCIFKFIKK
jgi:hypothetical protein